MPSCMSMDCIYVRGFVLCVFFSSAISFLCTFVQIHFRRLLLLVFFSLHFNFVINYILFC